MSVFENKLTLYHSKQFKLVLWLRRQCILMVFADGKIQQIDFAAIPFREQLKVVRGTNILIGMHGMWFNEYVLACL